jgi:hypothetical protein
MNKQSYVTDELRGSEQDKIIIFVNILIEYPRTGLVSWYDSERAAVN